MRGNSPQAPGADLDPDKPYGLAELIDLAEMHHPQTRMAWERARQAAESLKIDRAAYYPALAFAAYFGDERAINPFPKPLAPRGYTMAELPTAAPAMELQYALFDSGRRGARVDREKAGQLAAVASFQRSNQEVAYRVVRAYYDVVTSVQQLDAAQKILATARTTEDAAEARLQNGEATLPDVLNARAARAQSSYDLEAADGAVRLARVTLRESLGVEPSEDIRIAPPANSSEALQISESIQKLISYALVERPDLQQLYENLRGAEAEERVAKDSRLPVVTLAAKGGQTAVWPTSDYGQLGSANQTTWSVGVNLHWDLFTGGRLRAEEERARSQKRELESSLAERKNAVTREVWDSYLSFRTAKRQQESAGELLSAAETSYNASLEAYRYGVKNLIDVVTAEKQLASARLAQVQAESSVWVSAIRLEYATGHLLHRGKALAEPVQAEAGER